MEDDKIGKSATLKTPYRGYRNIEIVEATPEGYICEICGSGKQVEFREEEFIMDDE